MIQCVRCDFVKQKRVDAEQLAMHTFFRNFVQDHSKLECLVHLYFDVPVNQCIWRQWKNCAKLMPKIGFSAFFNSVIRKKAVRDA